MEIPDSDVVYNLAMSIDKLHEVAMVLHHAIPLVPKEYQGSVILAFGLTEAAKGALRLNLSPVPHDGPPPSGGTTKTGGGGAAGNRGRGG